MKDVLDDVAQWLSQGNSVALATLVSTEGSSPREPGAVMAVNSKGDVAGSISGGCVEAAVVEEALAVLETGQPRLLTYGIADDLGLSVGLTCGGTLHIFVEQLLETLPLTEVSLEILFRALRQSVNIPLALCTQIQGEQAGAKLGVTITGEVIGSVGNLGLDQSVARDAQGLLEQGLNKLCYYGVNGERRQTDVAVFIESFAPPPHLIIFGAVNFTRSLCQLAKMLGYQVTVCDARSRFATSVRFPEADNIVVEWPHRYLENNPVDAHTLIMVLTHDPKFDVPALVAAVKTPAAYIGAMGSRRANADRLRRLQEKGLTSADLARISAPLGLDIGARTPEETAVSIMAEVIALKSGRRGQRLSQTNTPIHPG